MSTATASSTGRSSTTRTARSRASSTRGRRRRRAASTTTDVDARLPRVGARARRGGLAAATACRRRRRRAAARSTRARCAWCARRSRATTGWPTSRSPCRAWAAARSRSPAPTSSGARWLPARRARAKRSRRSRSPSPTRDRTSRAMTTPAVRDGDAGCSTAGRRGSPTAASPTSTACSRGPAPARRCEGHLARSSSPRTRRASSIAERIDVDGAASARALAFEGCRVAGDALIGAEGDGFKLAMRTLDVFRASVAAAALGFARRALDEARRAREARSDVRRRARRPAAGAGDARRDGDGRRCGGAARPTAPRGSATPARRAHTREAAMAKLAATERAQRVIDAAVQLHRRAAACARARSSSGSTARSARLRIYEGATEVQRLIIGARRRRREARRPQHRLSRPRTSTRSRATTCRRARVARVPVRRARAAYPTR